MGTGRFCKDCVHARDAHRLGWDMARCYHEKSEKSPTTGEGEFCAEARGRWVHCFCGEEGEYFKERPPLKVGLWGRLKNYMTEVE